MRKATLLFAALVACGDPYLPPTIDSFTVDNANPPFATTVHLSYSVHDASTVTISPSPGVVSSSPVTVLPHGHTVYVLQASNIVGSVSKQVVVDPQIAGAAVKVTRFSVLPAQAPAGTPRTIAWTVTNGLDLTLRGGKVPLQTIAASGQITDTPDATTTYTILAASGPGYTPSQIEAHAVARVTAPASIASFAATPATIAQGDASTLSWDGSAVGWKLTVNGVSSMLGPAKSFSVRPSANTTYSLTALGVDGDSAPQTATVTVTPRAGTQLTYAAPAVTTQPLQLVADACAAPCTSLTLRLVAASAVSLRGVAFDLPLDATKVTLDASTFAGALDVGSAKLGSGPLQNTLVFGAARTASLGTPAADLSFNPGDEIAHFVLALRPDGGQGPVFDGSATFKAYIQSASGRTAGGIAVGRLDAQ